MGKCWLPAILESQFRNDNGSIDHRVEQSSRFLDGSCPLHSDAAPFHFILQARFGSGGSHHNDCVSWLFCVSSIFNSLDSTLSHGWLELT